MSAARSRLFVGLMSGTSVDGVDAVLMSVGRSPLALQTLALASLPFPSALRQAIQQLQSPCEGELELAAQVALDIAELYAEAALLVISRAGSTSRDINALGAHGQTVRHRPRAGFTLQLLNAARLAEITGIPVIYDFRSADVAAGGQGAPLVPAFHAHAFSDLAERRAVVNIGGIANISVLPPSGETRSEPVLGHDTGPGNTLLDQWHERHRGGPFDAGGAWAAGGIPDQQLLSSMLADQYFRRPPPKSTGRDDFNLAWIDHHLRARITVAPPHPSAQNVQATLAELAALTIVEACRASRASQVFLCGGGVHNADLVRRITAALPQCSVRTTEAVGIDPMAVEAAAFAWLAARRLDGEPGNLPAVTGASGGRVLGSIADPWGRLNR